MMDSASTYQAVQAVAPRRLALVRKPIRDPRPGEVRIRVEACGGCHSDWVVGQRVGVGFLGGFCGYREFCRGGELVNCRNQEFTGIHRDGGYAEMLIARARPV